MDHPGAVLFDAYGTLFDVYSVGQTAERLFAGQGQALAAGWRDKQIEYTRIVTTSDDGAHYQPFGELTRAALRYTCKRLGLDLTESAEQQLMDQYRTLTAFPECRDVLQALKCLDDPDSHRAVIAERAWLHEMGELADLPGGALANVQEGQMVMEAVLVSVDGLEIVRDEAEGPAASAEALGAKLAVRMLERGAREIVDALTGEESE